MIQLYTQLAQGQAWLQQHQGKRPYFACILGFTATGLIPGISAAGATPAARRYTAIADAEFLWHGPQAHPQYPLPPLTHGASPVLISHAIAQALDFPIQLFNAGLPVSPAVPHVDLAGLPAQCVSTGQALPRTRVVQLFEQGWQWGEQLANQTETAYLLIGECVVGGTTTALAVLEGLGVSAAGCVNSSHPQCNHAQKAQIAHQGLRHLKSRDPFDVVAAVGDPMQSVAAGMALAASRTQGVLLAGGTQMLAVYALMSAIARSCPRHWRPEQVVVGTTRWVAEDPTGNTVKLAQQLAPVCLMATQLNFQASRWATLRAYEAGYVKEGVGAGGCAIAASLYQNWDNTQLCERIDAIATTLDQLQKPQPDTVR